MARKPIPNLGFDDMLAQADADNRRRRFDHETSHLPSEIEEAVTLHRRQIKDHHAAMLALDLATALKIREEAHKMAVRVNHGEPGILANDDSPGNVISQRCRASAWKIPRWGQQGRFSVEITGDFTVGRKFGRWSSITVRVDLEGMFGIGSSFSPVPGFGAYVIDQDQPFISKTGFRSFLGAQRFQLTPGMTTEDFVKKAIREHIRDELKGSLVMVEF